MPPVIRDDPYAGYNFQVIVTGVSDDGIAVSGSFTEVSGLELEVDADRVPQRQRGHHRPQDPGPEEVHEHHAQARHHRRPRVLELDPAGASTARCSAPRARSCCSTRTRQEVCAGTSRAAGRASTPARPQRGQQRDRHGDRWRSATKASRSTPVMTGAAHSRRQVRRVRPSFRRGALRTDMAAFAGPDPARAGRRAGAGGGLATIRDAVRRTHRTAPRHVLRPARLLRERRRHRAVVHRIGAPPVDPASWPGTSAAAAVAAAIGLARVPVSRSVASSPGRGPTASALPLRYQRKTVRTANGRPCWSYAVDGDRPSAWWRSRLPRYRRGRSGRASTYIRLARQTRHAPVPAAAARPVPLTQRWTLQLGGRHRAPMPTQRLRPSCAMPRILADEPALFAFPTSPAISPTTISDARSSRPRRAGSRAALDRLCCWSIRRKGSSGDNGRRLAVGVRRAATRSRGRRPPTTRWIMVNDPMG